MKVSDLFNPNLIEAKPHDTLFDIDERMVGHGIHALPIIGEEGQAIGIVTSSDLDPGLSRDTPVVELMSDTIYEVDSQAEAREAAVQMLNLGVHHLVVTEGGKAVGILSSFDLLRVITEEK
jgi:CBS domain-containing protein